MFCPKCGAQNPEQHCTACGAILRGPGGSGAYKNANEEENPPTGRWSPLSAWAYWGLSILFAVPVIGFIFLIVFSFNTGNYHRRSFARSYWCTYILILIIFGIVLVVAGLTGGLAGLTDSFSAMFG